VTATEPLPYAPAGAQQDGPHAPAADRADEVLDAIGRVFAIMHAGVMDAGLDSLIELDLTISQARVLMVLAKREEPQQISELADRLGLSLAATGRNVDQLVRTGLADRREDPNDRRVRLVSLSDHGRMIWEQFHIAKRSQARNFVAQLSSDDQTRLLAALAPILDRLATPTTQESSACP
jgi:DNA-binding MarR family transcriptional regulator